jgi:ABC-type transporter Mla subunit MlaD
MRDRLRNTDRLVAIFTVVGILLLVAFSGLVMVKNNVLTDKVYFRTVLDNASGLGRKPPIYFKGLEIGRVDEFELDPLTNDISARFYVYKNYAGQIVRYSVISRIGSLVLGTSNEYEILQPQGDAVGELEPLTEGELVPFINSDLGQRYAKLGQIAVKFDSFEAVLTSVNEVLVNLQRESNPRAGELFVVLNKVEKIADSVLEIALQLENGQLVSETSSAIVALNRVIEKADAAVSEVDVAVAKAEAFFVAAEEVARQSRVMVDTAQSTFNTANSAFDTANSTFEKAQQAVVDANRFVNSANEAALHADRLLDDYEDPAAIISTVSENKIPATIDRVDASLVYLQAILKEVYLQREQLAEAIISMNKTLSSFDKTLQGVNNNPLLKDGIESGNRADFGIEVNEN